MPWKAAAEVAERFQQGRIFIAGDAAHVMPPNGGFGGNTGVQDAHNLAWKLAMVLRGAAGPDLLSTYEPERRPAAEFTVEQAYSRYVTRTAPYLGTAGIQPVENDLNVELGYCYSSSAVIGNAAGRPDPLHQNPRESRGRPGTRAPHVWLERDGNRLSTLDLFGSKFVLLGGPEATAWCGALSAAAVQGIEFDVHRVGAGLTDPEGLFPQAFGITSAGAALIRPDGFVGWRAETARDASPNAIARVLATLVHRASGTPA
jgi:hypothetical protein